MSNLQGVEILYSQKVIQKRVAEMAVEIEAAGNYDIVVGVLTGVVFFFSDLARFFERDYPYGFIAASSYTDTKSGAVVIHHDLAGDIRDKHILLLDDIADTGKTIGIVSDRFIERGAKVTTCCFLNRSGLTPLDFCGFNVDTTGFLVGYGLDMDGRFRNLPDIGVITSTR